MKEIEKIIFKVIRLNRPYYKKEQNAYYWKLKADKFLIVDLIKEEIVLLHASSKDKINIDKGLLSDLKSHALKYKSSNWLDIL